MVCGLVLALAHCAARPSVQDTPTRAEASRESDSCPLPPAQNQAGLARNVRGEPLAACPAPHRTGFYRNGYCTTGPEDTGVHVVCARVSDEFLSFSKAQGNDLITPRGSFPGLAAGDAWCLCAARWREALQAGVAPPVLPESTDERALRYVEAAAIESHAVR